VIYEVTFGPVDDGWRIVSVLVETDDGRHRRTGGDEFDRIVVELVLSAIVLGEPATDLRRRLVALTASDAPGLLLHSVLGLRTAGER
jgi:hypothetical protein